MAYQACEKGRTLLGPLTTYCPARLPTPGLPRRLRTGAYTEPPRTIRRQAAPEAPSYYRGPRVPAHTQVDSRRLPWPRLHPPQRCG